jgi:O-antigen/teichoic acid export membrane protein
MLPLTYIFAKQYDMTGPAVANLISITVYNIVRIAFLWKKFRLFPFTRQSIYILLSAAASYGVCYFLFENVHGMPGLILRSALFVLLYGGIVTWFRLSPDITPVLITLKNRLRIRRK